MQSIDVITIAVTVTVGAVCDVNERVGDKFGNGSSRCAPPNKDVKIVTHVKTTYAFTLNCRYSPSSSS